MALFSIACKCYACSLPPSNARLAFLSLAIQLHVQCLLSAYLRRVFLFYLVTGVLPALCLSLTRVSVLFGYCCVVSTLPRTYILFTRSYRGVVWFLLQRMIPKMHCREDPFRQSLAYSDHRGSFDSVGNSAILSG